MGIFKQFFSRSKEKEIKKQIDYKELSQYSPLQRYYNIQGEFYDIDSVESVLSIPVCHTEFIHNNEKWGIDTVLRFQSKMFNIPKNLKEACSIKNAEYENNGLKTESSIEKNIRIEIEQKNEETYKKLGSINNSDMLQFDKIKYDLSGDMYIDNSNIFIDFCDSDYNILNPDIIILNKLLANAIEKYNILPNDLCIKEFSRPQKSCRPYTPNRHLSKYPLIIHISSKSQELNTFEYYREHNSFPDRFGGKLYYLQNGDLGKAQLSFGRDTISYKFDFAIKEHNFIIIKIEYSDISDKQNFINEIYNYNKK